MSIDYRLKDFINTELREFSNYDNVRSIPSIIDGFKDSQRKAIFGAMTNGTGEIKLAQLSGIAALKTSYHHGEGSMGETLVGLAQNFPGSNNANLLEPIGQFGSILSPEAAAHRYIYTKPSKFLRQYIRKEDDPILKFREEEGQTLEPISYYPILPMWIVNGVVGIGTGHSVKILSRDPKKVASLVSKMVSGVSVQQKTIEAAMTPHFNGWGGEVVSLGESSFELRGKLEVVNTTTIRIQTLPIGYDVDKYKGILIKLMDEGVVKDFDNNSTENGFDFLVTVPREVSRRDPETLHSLFKLSARVTENVTLWDTSGKLRRYTNVFEALQEFVEYRKGVYEVRKSKQLEILSEELGWLKNKIAFITYWNQKLKDPHKKTKEELRSELGKVIDEKYFDRLLALQIRSLTMEAVRELEKQVSDLTGERDTLEKTTTESMFVWDLKDI